MGNLAEIQNRPQRALIAYCALADRLNKPGANMLQALVPFFEEACRDFAGEVFDANKFSQTIKMCYGIEIPRLAVLGIAEQLSKEGVLEVLTDYSKNISYKYSTSIGTKNREANAISENDINQILNLFTEYCTLKVELNDEEKISLNNDFLERLLNIDSMRLLSRREESIATKKTNTTLQLNSSSSDLDNHQHARRLDFLVSNFLIHLRETNQNAFEIVSNIAFANMAAEAIACFREPPNESNDLSNLTVLLDTPLILDMLGVNTEYEDYGNELLSMLKESNCNISVLDHSIAETENTIQAKYSYLRSGVNQIVQGISISPNTLFALIGNVAERVQNRLKISIEKDPEINLHRSFPSTVGDIQANMDSRMLAWKNIEAKNHDKQSVWAMIALRDTAVVQPKICNSGWMLLTKNTVLMKIANDSWKTWLKGATNHGPSLVERWTPVAMTDKQFAGYIWARNGGGPSTISQSLLLAHCSAAVRPRADIKAKAYNLILSMYGLDKAQDIVALFEDREGGKALMQATLGDPEDVTIERIPYIIEQVKLGAGEFAAKLAREEAQRVLDAEREKNAQEMFEIRDASKREIKALDDEKTQTAQQLFEQQRQIDSLKLHTDNLKLDLDNKNKIEIYRKFSILNDGFVAGKREYNACRLLIALLYSITGCLIAINYFNISSPIIILLTILISFLGYGFVPSLLEKWYQKKAESRFLEYVKNIDSSIKVAIYPNFVTGIYPLDESHLL